VTPLAVPGLLVAVVATVVILTRPEYGIAATIALAPLTNFSLSAGDEGSFKPFQLLLPAMAFGLLVYAVLVTRTTTELRRTSWLAGAVLVFVGAAAASSFQALEPAESVKKMFIFLTAAALFFTVIHVCRTRRQLVAVAAGGVVALLIASGQGVLQRYVGEFSTHGFEAGGEIVRRVQGSFGHPNQYGGFVAVLIPLAVAFVATRAFPLALRWMAAAALALALPALVFSYVRGAIAALVIGSLIWLALLRPRAAALAAVGVAVVGFAFAPATLRERFESNTTSGGDVTLREDLWGAALDIYADHPVLGVGLNNFGEAYAQLPAVLPNATQRRLLHNTEVLTPPHAANQYLNILAEQGVVGIAAFALFAFVAVAAVYRGSRAVDPAARAISLAMGAGLLTLAAHGMLEVTLQTEIALPLFTLLGVVAAFGALDARDREAEPEPEATA
jgi:O-antigen ligase